jgi:hypothetical protein
MNQLQNNNEYTMISQGIEQFRITCDGFILVGTTTIPEENILEQNNTGCNKCNYPWLLYCMSGRSSGFYCAYCGQLCR